MLTPRNSPGFAYYSDVALADENSTREIWHMSITKLVMVGVSPFPAAAQDGMVGVAHLDLQKRVHACGL